MQYHKKVHESSLKEWKKKTTDEKKIKGKII